MRTRRRENTGETGAAAVEFALVLPLLFVLLFGIIEFGFGLFQLQAAQATVREAARGVALGVDDCAEVDGTRRPRGPEQRRWASTPTGSTS